MTTIESKIAKALGKKRMAKVSDIFDDGRAVDIQLTDDTGDCWEYKINGYGDFTMTEVIFYAKRFIDESEATAVIRLDRKVF
jgi:hypothetical protein